MALGCQRSEPVATVVPEAGFAEQLQSGRSGSADRIELAKTVVDDATLSLLGEDDEWLDTLILDQGMISDSGIEGIARLPSIRHLRLRISPISDEGFARLATIPSLQILNLPHCDATPAGIGTLAELPDLRSLRLGGARLDDSTAEAVASIPTLRHVHLIGAAINDEGLKRIAELPKLQSLYLDDSEVSEEGWDWLFEAHPDLHVHVNQQHLDREEHKHEHP